MVLQTPRPFETMTVRENVVLGALFGSTEGRLVEVDGVRAGRRGARVRRDSPNARDDDVGTLNLHEQRFLELARALAGRPQLLLLDEVMAGLNDTELQASIEIVRTARDRARRDGDLGRARHEGGDQPRRADRRAQLRPAARRRRARRRDARSRRSSPPTSASGRGPAVLEVADLSAGYVGQHVVHAHRLMSPRARSSP